MQWSLFIMPVYHVLGMGAAVLPRHPPWVASKGLQNQQRNYTQADNPESVNTWATSVKKSF